MVVAGYVNRLSKQAVPPFTGAQAIPGPFCFEQKTRIKLYKMGDPSFEEIEPNRIKGQQWREVPRSVGPVNSTPLGRKSSVGVCVESALQTAG